LIYDSIIIGGGIAGLQAAIQLGRYKHDVLVIDAGYGRSTLCRDYHNLLGWPEGISGEKLRKLGQTHASGLGVKFIEDEVVSAEKHDLGFHLFVKHNNKNYIGKTLLLATGVMDRFPNLPGLVPCLGLSVYICPDCDGYEVSGKRTLVFGAGDVGAGMAISLTYWTEDLIYINHELKPLSTKYKEKLNDHGISYVEQPIKKVLQNQGEIRGIILENDKQILGNKAFIAFGGNHVKTELARQLGIERMENNHIMSDPRTKQTNIKRIWAAGDIGVHSEQVTIAMGEGSQAAIWMHKTLLEMKKSKAPVTV
jgi:thioredoxin reductase (NADPH)